MKKVYLHGSLGEKFGKEWTLSVRSASESFSAIDANVEGFVEYLSERARDGVNYCITTKNPKDIKDDGNKLKYFIGPSKLNLNLSSQEIHITPIPQGGMGLLSIGGFAGFMVKAFLFVAATMIIQGILNSLFKPPKREDPTTTKSYLFQGAQNRQQQGIPVPLGYGRLKIGSAVVSTSKKSFNLNGDETSSTATENMKAKKVMQSFSEFKVLELLSEGPIEGFCNANGALTSELRESIFFDDTPVKNTTIGKITDAGVKNTDVLGTFNFVLNERGVLPKAKNGEIGEKIPFGKPEITFDKRVRLIGPGPYTGIGTGAGDPRPKQSHYGSMTEEFFEDLEEWRKNKEEAKQDALRNLPTSSNTLITEDVSDYIDGPHIQTFDAAQLLSATVQSHSIRSNNARKIRIAFQARGQIQNDQGGNGPVTQKFAIRLNYGNRMYFIGGTDKNFNASIGNLSSYIGASFKEAENFLTVENGAQGNPIFAINGLATDPFEFDIEFELPKDLRDYEKYVNDHDDLLKAFNEYVDNGRIGAAGGFQEGLDNMSKPDWGRVHWQKHGQSGTHTEPRILSTEKLNPVIQIIKLTRELDPSIKGNDPPGPPYYHSGGANMVKELTLESITEILGDDFTYPHSAMMEVLYDSKNFGSVPRRSYHCKLKKVLIPSNYDPVSRKYVGPWDGLFKGQDSELDTIYSISDRFKFWTDNPAWIFYDLITNTRFGLGKYGVTEDFVDKWSLYKVSRYCDELVETGYPDDQLGNGQAREFFTTNNKSVLTGNLTSGEAPTFNSAFKANFIRESGFEVEFPNLNTDLFKERFGSGGSFKGIKVAFFMSDKTIEERVIVSSDPSTKTIILKGPSFESHPTTVITENSSGEILKTTSSNVSDSKTGAISQIRHPLVEPRFSANIYITDRMEAIDLINQMAAIFRSMIVYFDGKISTVQDSIKNTVAIFNNSNVAPEGFTYVGTVKNKKFSAVVVRYNDKDDNFKSSVVYEEDQEAMQKFGYVEEEIMAWGTTSKAQAVRLAKWALFSSQRETESVNFETGQEASFLFPGAVFEISDEKRSGKNNSGRLLGTFVDEEYTTQPYVLLDKIIKDAPVGMVEITMAAGLSRSTLQELNDLAKYDRDGDDQIARVDGNHTPQLIKFQGVVKSSQEHKADSPQNQESIVGDLRVKFEISVDIESNRFNQFNHPFEEGDLVTFVSEGSPPAPLSEYISYYIVDPEPHSFKVSYGTLLNPINITDTGLNEHGSAGGVHYISPVDIESTRKELRKVGIGAPWIMKGIFAVKSPGRMSLTQLQNLEVETIASEGELSGVGWYKTTWLGDIYIPDDRGWIYSVGLGFVYLGNVMDGVIGGSYWFFIPGAGWIWTNNSLKKTYWYVYGHDDDQGGPATGSSAGWVYLEQGEDKNGAYVGPINGFAYDDNFAAYSVGQEYTLGVGTSQDLSKSPDGVKTVLGSNGNFTRGALKKVLKTQNSPKGVWFRWNELTASQNYVPIAPSVTGTAKPSSTEFSHNSSIKNIDITDITFNTSTKQGSTQILVHSSDNNSLNERDFLIISGFNSSNSTLNNLLNKKHNVIKLSGTLFEIINSSDIALNSTYKTAVDAVTGSNFGKFTRAVAPVNPTDRQVKSQLFRCVSVSESKDNLYEVTGIEYDSTKFDAVDKNNIIKKPAFPIPPQEDMSLPDPPTKIFLTDLSPK